MPAKLVIVTTVPETLDTILKGQPYFLSRFFEISLITSPGPTTDVIAKTEMSPVYSVSMVRGISPIRDLMAVLTMARLLRRLHPDIIHSYTPKAGLVLMLAGRLCKVPIRIHTFTGLIFPAERHLRKILLKWVDKLICTCATTIVPEGEGVKKDLKNFNITKKTLEVIGHGNIAGVNIEYFSSTNPEVLKSTEDLRISLAVNSGDFIFCYVGRLNRDKGILELLGAFSQLPDHCRLVIVGALDNTAPIPREHFEMIKSHPRIHSLGFQSDIRAALNIADVLVLPSYREGFPNSVLQAGAMGIPSIVTDVNGSNEIITPGVNGWVIPAKSTQSLAHAMRVAIHTPSSTLNSMGQQARERVAKYFEQDKYRRQLVNFYNVALGNEKLN